MLVDVTTGSSYSIGGWGHLFGDEGGAYWISLRALKAVIDHDDNMKVCEFSTDFVKQNMKDYFKVDSNADMLHHFYSDFKESDIAGFAVRLAEGARQKDPLCLSVFAEAGVVLAKHVIAVCRKSGIRKKTMTIICVGSVWQSWEYMAETFQSTVSTIFNQCSEIVLVKLRGNGAIGAAVVGARDSGYMMPIDYSKHTETICILSKPKQHSRVI